MAAPFGSDLSLQGGHLGVPQPPPEVARIWESAPSSRTPVEWALRWFWDYLEVTMVLSGINEKAHVTENLTILSSAFRNSLTPQETDLVTQAADTCRRLMAVNCNGSENCITLPLVSITV
jgi:uncharacterized protein